jgi:hypothetical protein
MRWAGHIARTRAMKNQYEILVGKPEWKRQLERRMLRCEDNIRMDLKEIMWKMWTGFIWLIASSSVLL